MSARPCSDSDVPAVRIGRRGFLQGAALASTAAIGTLAVDGTPRRAAAVEPIKRTGTSKFKFSLAAYSYRDLLTGKAGKPAQLTLEDFMADCAKMQLEGTELTGYYFPNEPTPEYLRKIKAAAFRLGLDVSGTAIRNDFCYPTSNPQRAKELAHVKRWIDYADILGAPVIRVFSGDAHDTDQAEAHRLAVAGFEEACDYAGQHGIFLALENHGGISTKADDLVAIARDVKSPWFAINLDSGNFHTEDPYADMAKIAPYAMNVQIKVVIKDPQGKKRPSDYKRIAKILSDVGYRGYIVLEYEENEDPRVACPKHMQELREAFASHA